MDRHPISDEEYKTLEFLNNLFSWLFFAEMVLKLIGMGFKEYAKDKFNLFDAVIVVLSTVENIL